MTNEENTNGSGNGDPSSPPDQDIPVSDGEVPETFTPPKEANPHHRPAGKVSEASTLKTRYILGGNKSDRSDNQT